MFHVRTSTLTGHASCVLEGGESLAELVRSGKVQLAAAVAVSDAPEELDAMLHRREPPPGAHAPPPQPSEPPPAGGRGLLQRAGAIFGKKGGG